MLVKVILIIDKRKEQSTKYKKLLESDLSAVFCVNNPNDALTVLNDFEPDLILISDSIQEDVCDLIKKLRMLSCNTRPVIVSLSKSDHIQYKIDALDAGADDFLSEPIEQNEFKARISAHIRRHFENDINECTSLFNSKTSFKILKRIINKKEKWAALLVDIDNFDFYKEIYGELAADKMLQTYTAIINSALDNKDFAGQLNEHDFLIITSPIKAEKIAQYLIFAFNTVVEKFYSENDLECGYIVMHGDEKAGNKVSLVSTSIGIISNEHKDYTNLKQAVNSLISAHKLAKLKTGSSYMVERPEISAENSVIKKEYNNNILIVEPDEALSLLLYTTSQMQNYNARIINSYTEIFDLENYHPAVIILDAGNTEELKGINICSEIKEDERYADSKIILSSTLHDKRKILSAGADLYVPKPYELSTIFNWVEKFIKDFNT